jgi:type II secretory pathway component PulF
MALYVYQGFSKEGKKITGQVDAPSEGGVRELLQRQGVYPISIVIAHKTQSSGSFFQKLFEGKVSLKDKLIFTKQLSVLLRSSVPLLQALDLLDDQFDGQLKNILVSVKDGIKEGGSLAEGLKRYPHVFENTYVQLVKAGEASGKLETILDRLVEYLEAQETMRNKITSALRGPLIQLVLILTIAFALMIFVVPKMTQTMSTQGKELPLVTELVMGFSYFVLNYYLLLAVIIFSSVTAFLYWKSTPDGAYTVDALKLKIPVVQFFARIGAVVQFCSTLGMLLEAGVHLSEALTIVCDIVDNRVLKNALEEAKENIIKQGKIAQYLKKTQVFPIIAIYLIETGEESGNLDKMLLEVSKNYEKDLSEKADGLSALLQPAMLLVMAVVVGTIVIAVALPMVSMGDF